LVTNPERGRSERCTDALTLIRIQKSYGFLSGRRLDDNVTALAQLVSDAAPHEKVVFDNKDKEWSNLFGHKTHPNSAGASQSVRGESDIRLKAYVNSAAGEFR
jgi:hypothetical protein